MKKCPYCGEEIRDDAIKCSYCGGWLEKIETVSSEITAPKPSAHQQAELKYVESSNFPPKDEKPDDLLKKSNMPLYVIFGGWLFNLVYYTFFSVRFFGKILTIPNLVGFAALVFSLTLVCSIIVYIALFIIKLFKGQRLSFFIPSIMVFLLTFATISLGHYQKIYDKYGNHPVEKRDKINWDSSERKREEFQKAEKRKAIEVAQNKRESMVDVENDKEFSASKGNIPSLKEQTKSIKSFLNEFCRAYETKDLDRFFLLFAADATENNIPFNELKPKYQENMKNIELFKYRIDMIDYSVILETGNTLVQGNFYLKYRVHGGSWKENSGNVKMELSEKDGSYRVRRLNYGH